MKLTERSVAAAALPVAPQQQIFYFDDRLTGFGLRVAATGRRSFVAQARVRRTGRVRRLVIGGWPAMSVEDARAKARPLLAACGAGHDPRADHSHKSVPTLGDFIPIYLAHAQAHKRSAKKDAGDLARYLPRAFYARPLDDFTPADMVALHTEIGKRGPYVANCFLRLLRALFNRARDWGHLPETALNPVRKVTFFPEHKRERFLSLDEFDRFSASLEQEEQLWRDYFRLLLLTAQRRNEVGGLRWAEVDLDAAVWILPAEWTKANRATRIPLCTQAVAILRDRRAVARPDAEYVFVSPRKPRAPIREVKAAWRRILTRAGIDNARVHDLRRTTASYAAAAGESLQVIGKLLNHSRPETTAIYSRLDLGPVRAAIQRQADALDSRRPT